MPNETIFPLILGFAMAGGIVWLLGNHRYAVPIGLAVSGIVLMLLGLGIQLDYIPV